MTKKTFTICLLFLGCPDLRCWLTNRSWCQLRSQRSAGALAGNQLLSNVTLKPDGKALIDLVDGLSSGSVVLVSMTDDDLADHDARLFPLFFNIPDARLGAEPSNISQAMAIKRRPLRRHFSSVYCLFTILRPFGTRESKISVYFHFWNIH